MLISVALIRHIAGSMLMMGVLGCVYGWSLFSPLLRAQYGLTPEQLQLVFGVSIALYSILMLVTGWLYRHVGIRPLLWVSALTYGGGYVLASQLSQGHPLALTLCIGGLSALGVACGYVTILSHLMRAMAPKTGIASGLVAAAFGGGASLLALVLGPALAHPKTDVLALLTPLGLGFMGLMAIGALLIPAHLPTASVPDTPPEIPSATPTALPREKFWTPDFLLMLAGMLCGTLSGFLVLSQLKPLALTMGASETVSTLVVGAFSVGNAGGRLLWGMLGDRLGPICLPLALGLLSVMLLLFAQAGPFPVLLPVATGLVALMFGACFVLFANQLARRYGVETVSQRYPILLLGQAVSALTAPWASSWAQSAFHHPAGSVWLASLIALAGAILVAPLALPANPGHLSYPKVPG